MDVSPLAHSARADEVLAQALLLLAVAELVHRAVGRPLASPRLDPAPQPERAHELRLLVVEGLVLCVGRGLRLEWAVAHVLPGQRRGDDEHLAERAALARLEDHAADARIERQLRQLAA